MASDRGIRDGNTTARPTTGPPRGPWSHTLATPPDYDYYAIPDLRRPVDDTATQPESFTLPKYIGIIADNPSTRPDEVDVLWGEGHLDVRGKPVDSIGIIPESELLTIRLNVNDVTAVHATVREFLHEMAACENESQSWLGRAVLSSADQSGFDPSVDSDLHLRQDAGLGRPVAVLAALWGSSAVNDRVLTRYIVKTACTWALVGHFGVPYPIAKIVAKYLADSIIGRSTGPEKLGERAVSLSEIAIRHLV
ncbi:MAG: hypothetical protein L0K86_18295 [Actinomycetia bacterium]|nr:hypothetical protein [Actinomycetes bacterium]